MSDARPARPADESATPGPTFEVAYAILLNPATKETIAAGDLIVGGRRPRIVFRGTLGSAMEPVSGNYIPGYPDGGVTITANGTEVRIAASDVNDGHVKVAVRAADSTPLTERSCCILSSESYEASYNGAAGTLTLTELAGAAPHSCR